MSRNDEIATLLEEFADLLEAQDVEYKPRTYRRAAENIREYSGAVEDLAADGEESVQKIEGVGDAIASKVVEYFETGEIEELEELREDLPVDMDALTRVEGVGPKTVGTLYEALGVRTLEDLAAAAENGEIQDVSGFGAKTEQNILENLEFAREAAERELLGDARPRGEEVLAYLDDQSAVERVDLAGATTARRSSRPSPTGRRPTRSSRPATRKRASGPGASASTCAWSSPGSSVPPSSISPGARTTTSRSGTAPSRAT